MAQPLPSRKQSVDLAGGARKVGSRIRRAPPPPAPKQVTTAELREREKWVVVTGIVAVALAVCVILFSAARWSGWSASDYRVEVEQRD